MVIAAMVCTILAGILGSFLVPTPFGVSIPIAVMGGFIIKLVYEKIDEAVKALTEARDTPTQEPVNDGEEKADEEK